METSKQKFLNAKGITEITLLISEFCTLLDEVEHYSPFDFIKRMSGLLNLIYTEVLLLPDPQDYNEFETEKFVTEEDWQQIHDRLILFFDVYNRYYAIHDLLWEDNEARETSLAEELADVYQDLKDFISLYNLGTEDAMFDAVNELKQTFADYWGRKITRVLPVMHDLIHFSNIHKLSYNKESDQEPIPVENTILSNRLKNYNV